MIYLNGSLKDPLVPQVAEMLRSRGYEVFDDWHASGPRADEHWRTHEMSRGRNYREALQAPFARHVFDFDVKHIMLCDAGVAIGKPSQLPGRSGLIELMFMRYAMRVPTFVLLQGNPDDWDQMLPLAVDPANIFDSLAELKTAFPERCLTHHQV
jgi:hypothetical protein